MSEHKVVFEEGDSQVTHALHSKAESEADTNPTHAHPVCLVCESEEASFQPICCDCAFSYCKKCAMKCATGGKCKKCNAFFGSLRKSDRVN